MASKLSEEGKRVGVFVGIAVLSFCILLIVHQLTKNIYIHNLEKSVQAVCDAMYPDTYTVKRDRSIVAVRSTSIVGFTLDTKNETQDHSHAFVVRVTSITGSHAAVYIETNNRIHFAGLAGVKDPLIPIDSVGLSLALVESGQKKLEILLEKEDIHGEK